MRIDQFVGFYVQYQGAGQPVETWDRKAYAFTARANRTCLVTDHRHLAQLMRTERDYRIVGVEVAGEFSPTRSSAMPVGGGIGGPMGAVTGRTDLGTAATNEPDPASKKAKPKAKARRR